MKLTHKEQQDSGAPLLGCVIVILNRQSRGGERFQLQYCVQNGPLYFEKNELLSGLDLVCKYDLRDTRRHCSPHLA